MQMLSVLHPWRYPLLPEISTAIFPEAADRTDVHPRTEGPVLSQLLLGAYPCGVFQNCVLAVKSK